MQQNGVAHSCLGEERGVVGARDGDGQAGGGGRGGASCGGRGGASCGGVVELHVLQMN